ncbi:methyltransferase domain-containing protein [Zopfia rhizophila CBS 207.26]|uniref:Methyltransferase domain-containing protein n=1 Tax=Zopfia rhizophila CBS 207.26 TaxID=1314779 RepID=A0A6A6EHY7_9PEZI|nr:methyltransferase domain-containing protein [Zopfia rhizophila CBS 207.26]
MTGPTGSTQPNPAVPSDLKNRLKDSYDAIALHYNNFTRQHDPIRLHYLGQLLSHLDSKDKTDILELGCGAGIPGTKLLLEHANIHVTGNDLSTTQLQLAKQNLAEFSDRLKFLEGDMMDLSFAEKSFDVVMGFYSVIHLPRDEQVELLKRIVRWLKPGGLFLANFSAEEMPVAFEEKWLDQEKGWMFWSGWGAEGSCKMVEEAGLEILIREIKEDVVDANFLWVLGRKREA